MPLKDKVIRARYNLEIVKEEYEEVRERYNWALNEWRNAVAEIEEADYQQALIDGRTKKVQMGAKTPKPLTLEQIQNVAKKLGLELDIEETANEEDN